MLNTERLYDDCRLCPRLCGVDRLAGRKGSCGMSAVPAAASVVLHKGEEPPLSGENGSGAVFFTGCTLGCPFCQNIQISGGGMGAELDEDALSDIFLELQSRGAANINLVTATQYVPSVISAVGTARINGLALPVLWNSSGYELPDTIDLLGDIIDVWLPDMKTMSSRLAGELFGVSDYPVQAARAIEAMSKQVERRGGLLIEDGIMRRGMIVRHLVMPGEIHASRDVLKWFAKHYKNSAMLSVMVQYTPVDGRGSEIAGPDYVLPDNEYNMLLGWLDEFGIEEGFLQEPEAASSEWIPDFSRENPFPPQYSEPLWHWKRGLLG